MRRRLSVLIALLLFLLCGCFDYNELNMQELVDGAGIDVSGDVVTVNVLCAATAGEEAKAGSKYTGEGGSFFDAVRSLGKKADKKLYWGHARCLVLGEAAVESIDEILGTVLRAQDVYLDIIPVIAKGGSAADILAAKPASGRDVTESLADMFANEANSRQFSAKRVWEILREREGGRAYILPTAVRMGEGFELSGGAVIRGGELLGYLSGEQMMLYLLLTKDGAGGYLPPIELSHGRKVSFEILANRVEEKGANVLQSCVLSPAEVRGEVSIGEMESAAESYLAKGFSSLLSFAKAQGFSDIFGEKMASAEIKSEVRVSNILGGK